MRPCREEAPAELLKAIEEFNRGDWFQAHETLEELWVGEKGELRDLYQGLLQLAVALHHWRHGNFKGAKWRAAAVCEAAETTNARDRAP